MRYAVTFSPRTGHSQVHSTKCRVIPLAKRTRTPVTFVDAPDAAAAAAQFMQDEELVERGLPATDVCPCATR